VLASHISPPFSEAAKVILKVSQNLHAEICSRVVGGVVGGVLGAGAEDAGYRVLADFLVANSVTSAGIVQGDACGMWSSYSPNFMCRMLRAIATHSIYPHFLAALPILGRDGTLANVLPNAIAAGCVFAKTGTLSARDRLTDRAFVEVKALAGYIESASGTTFAFAIYANNVLLEPGESVGHVGTLLGEIVDAIYQIV
jgi:D-alanyl-D-alanine carboxypeptidase/D-alanyl-D-alanine-endopeptidase (penicillin-binding protein 4)